MVHFRYPFRAPLHGRPVWGTCPRGEIYADDESILELQQGTFITKSGGTLTFANGTSAVFKPGTSTTYNVTAGQVGVTNFKGTFVNYTAGGTSLVKVLNYPRNATAIRHDNSPNLIEVPAYLPPNVTALTSTFSNCSSFNHPNVTLWNVSKVGSMSYMFSGCTNFNQDIGNWDVSNVTNMGYMFNNCSVFNRPIGQWNTSQVTNMNNMFRGCKVFNQSLNDWDTGNVTNMNYMFRGCTAFNQDLSLWCVPLILSTPIDFNRGATGLTAAKLPVWGTCPSAVVTITEPMNIVMGETLTAQFTTVPAIS